MLMNPLRGDPVRRIALIALTSGALAACGSSTDSDRTVASVTVSLSSTTLPAEDRLQATAAVLNASGDPMTGVPIEWTVSNESVAFVNPSGLVTGLAPGTTSITATASGKAGSASLTVEPPRINTMTVSLSAPVLLTAGGSQAAARAMATAVLEDVEGYELTDRPITWTTSDAAVATVVADDSGYGVATVTAVGAGHCTITATSGSQSASAEVTVNQR
jgi:uncharacterized protein YjdB